MIRFVPSKMEENQASYNILAFNVLVLFISFICWFIYVFRRAVFNMDLKYESNEIFFFV